MAEASVFAFLPDNVCQYYVAGFCIDGERCVKEHRDIDLESGDPFANGHETSDVV